MAEDTGFEPAEPFGSTVFKTAAFDHSANPPYSLGNKYNDFSHKRQARILFQSPNDLLN